MSIGKPFLFLSLHLVFFPALSQTGPAGVGTSATNVLWLKADAGTSSSVNAAPISSWADQSGNGVDVAQSTAAQQPLYSTNIINGFPAILFDNNGAAGQNDKMIGPDSPLLDNTAGYTFFYVTRPLNMAGDARSIVSKRVGVGIDQSFMIFYYTSNKINVDIQTTNDRFASVTNHVNSTNYLGCLIYDGSNATAGLRCTLYNAEAFDRNASESNTSVPDNVSPLLVGTTDASDPRPFGGYIAEIIMYRAALGNAERIILNNSLSSKYDITLSANDRYAGDTPGNGDYDRQVAGLGRETTGSSPSFSASTTGGFGMSVTSGLDVGDYIMAGHATVTNATITTDVGGMTGPNRARWSRIWYVDVTNAGTAMTANLEFDMSEAGMTGATPGVLANYVLLYRAGTSGNWLEVSTASSISGDRIIFSAQPATGDGYVTLGTRNFAASPLPVSLISFNAAYNDGAVELNWSTASEKNNDHFTLGKSRDGIIFESFAEIKGRGTSSVPFSYKSTDPEPFPGTSYYRLKQTDYDGKETYSDIIAVTTNGGKKDLVIFPNPNSGSFKIKFPDAETTEIELKILDNGGKEIISALHLVKQSDGLFLFDQNSLLSPGTYLLNVSSFGKKYSTVLLVK